MKDLLIIGAGKIGQAAARLLCQPQVQDWQVTVADQDPAALATLPARCQALALDLADTAALRRALAGRWAVLCAAPYSASTRVADAAQALGVHYLDLTEDVAATRHIRTLAAGAGSAFIPQCGLAPGFINIVGADLAARFDTLDSLRLRVGALPAYPSNALNYNLTWSTEGVINEYIAPCEAIVDGRRCEVPALEEREEFTLDGVLYEAFNTSGGLGTLADTLAGRVRTLNYRTIRYPGHAAIMKALLHDLRLKDRRELLQDILENALPATLQDVVVVFATASGLRGGRLMQETYAHKVYARPVGGTHFSAIALCTASAACAMLDLLAQGRLPQQGFVRQEQVALADFLGNRFGSAYANLPAQALAA